jgi:hypothetical protein
MPDRIQCPECHNYNVPPPDERGIWSPQPIRYLASTGEALRDVVIPFLVFAPCVLIAFFDSSLRSYWIILLAAYVFLGVVGFVNVIKSINGNYYKSKKIRTGTRYEYHCKNENCRYKWQIDMPWP